MGGCMSSKCYFVGVSVFVCACTCMHATMCHSQSWQDFTGLSFIVVSKGGRLIQRTSLVSELSQSSQLLSPLECVAFICVILPIQWCLYGQFVLLWFLYWSGFVGKIAHRPKKSPKIIISFVCSAQVWRETLNYEERWLILQYWLLQYIIWWSNPAFKNLTLLFWESAEDRNSLSQWNKLKKKKKKVYA